MLGRAPIIDFDGTLTHLPVNWAALRSRLGVRTLSAVAPDRAAAWELVTQAEVAAATDAEVLVEVASALQSCIAFAVLTDNSESAVAAFLERHPSLARLCVLVTGRETLHASKRDPEAFERGFTLCLEATAASCCMSACRVAS